ncbi:MAG: hypothetical protein IJ867_04610 [Clostridia bacterium]|nr:hypothetical protein [Clostridia bacterium]
MEYLKFIPEGWNERNENLSLENVKSALDSGEIMQGKVYECDSNFNLHVKLRREFDGDYSSQ